MNAGNKSAWHVTNSAGKVKPIICRICCVVKGGLSRLGKELMLSVFQGRYPSNGRGNHLPQWARGFIFMSIPNGYEDQFSSSLPMRQRDNPELAPPPTLTGLTPASLVSSTRSIHDLNRKASAHLYVEIDLNRTAQPIVCGSIWAFGSKAYAYLTPSLSSVNHSGRRQASAP